MRKKIAWLWLALFLLSSLLARLGHLRYAIERSLLPPSWTSGLGTDVFGRGLFMLTLRSAFTSLGLALSSTGVALLLGYVFCGLVLLSPKWIRFPLRRSLEFFLALPSILVALAFAVLRGPGWTTLFLAMLLGSAPAFARLVLGRAEELLAEPYVDASRSLGTPASSIFRRHLIPPLLSYGSVKIPNLVATALLSEAALSFMGIGAPIGSDSWGLLLMQGRDYLLEAPHIAVVSGIPLVLTMLALQSLTEEIFQSLPNQAKLSK